MIKVIFIIGLISTTLCQDPFEGYTLFTPGGGGPGGPGGGGSTNTYLIDNNLNLALVSLTSSLIFWVIYSLILDVFDVRIFAWVISLSGFLLGLFVFFVFELPTLQGSHFPLA